TPSQNDRAAYSRPIAATLPLGLLFLVEALALGVFFLVEGLALGLFLFVESPALCRRALEFGALFRLFGIKGLAFGAFLCVKGLVLRAILGGCFRRPFRRQGGKHGSAIADERGDNGQSKRFHGHSHANLLGAPP